MNWRFLLLSVISLLANLIAYSQQDTLYVLYENHAETGLGPTYNTRYPEDRWGRNFPIKKINGNFQEELLFTYQTSYPNWMDTLHYRYEHISILQKQDFKDMKWFEQTSYSKIVGEFEKANVILIAEKRRIKNDSLCLIKVSFHYPVKE